ncbi:MAG TPA: aminopeptidase, partial [Actinomycetota bacterium]|nr:aminopeptidase [Actinomycetota bacterium]
MADPRLERLADVIVSYSTRVRPGDLVVIDSTPLGAPIARETYRRVLAAGGHPVVHVGVDAAAESLLR